MKVIVLKLNYSLGILIGLNTAGTGLKTLHRIPSGMPIFAIPCTQALTEADRERSFCRMPRTGNGKPAIDLRRTKNRLYISSWNGLVDGAVDVAYYRIPSHVNNLSLLYRPGKY